MRSVAVKEHKVLEVVKTSLGKQYDDITVTKERHPYCGLILPSQFLGGCQGTSKDGPAAAGLKTILDAPISDSASPKARHPYLSQVELLS